MPCLINALITLTRNPQINSRVLGATVLSLFRQLQVLQAMQVSSCTCIYGDGLACLACTYLSIWLHFDLAFNDASGSRFPGNTTSADTRHFHKWYRITHVHVHVWHLTMETQYKGQGFTQRGGCPGISSPHLPPHTQPEFLTPPPPTLLQ